MWRRLLLGCLAVLLARSEVQAQTHRTAFPNSVYFETGWGYASIRDEFISKERYSGLLPSLSVRWSRFDEKNAWSLGLGYSRSTRIKNHNVSAEIAQFCLDLDILYPVGRPVLFSRDLSVYLGPSSELFLHVRRQNIAGGGLALFDAYSFASLFSLAVKTQVIYPVRPRLQLVGSVRLTVVSLGARIVDPNREDKASPVKLLTPASGLNGSGDLVLGYMFLRRLSVAVGYRLQVMRITAWDPILSATDTLIAGLSLTI